MKSALLSRLNRLRADKHPVALVTDLNTGQQALVEGDGKVHGDFGLFPEDLETVRAWIKADRSGIVEAGDQRLFVHSFAAPLRLIVVGAVHIAQALVPMARLAGYEVVVVDPRRAFATEARFPSVVLNHDWPDDALRSLAIDSRTAVVTLTHDPKLDDPALHIALASPAFYVGCLGSRKTHAKRVGRLQEAGFAEAAIRRIHAPVGLDIGAVSPAEIALSILAEVTKTLRQPSPEGG